MRPQAPDSVCQPPAAESAERAGAPEAEVEVTSTMLDAGVTALKRRYFDLCTPELDFYPEIVRTVYLAMAAARP